MVLLSNMTDSAQNWKLLVFVVYLHQAEPGLSPVIKPLDGFTMLPLNWNVSQIVINVTNTGRILWEVKERGSFKEMRKFPDRSGAHPVIYHCVKYAAIPWTWSWYCEGRAEKASYNLVSDLLFLSINGIDLKLMCPKCDIYAQEMQIYTMPRFGRRKKKINQVDLSNPFIQCISAINLI